MPTPKQLEQLALDRGWTYRALAEAITAASAIDVSLDSVRRFCLGIGRPSRVTRAAINKFMAAQPKKRQAEVSR